MFLKFARFRADSSYYYLFLTNLQKNVHTVCMEKIYSLSSKVTSYVFFCKNMNVNICLEVDLL